MSLRIAVNKQSPTYPGTCVHVYMYSSSSSSSGCSSDSGSGSSCSPNSCGYYVGFVVVSAAFFSLYYTVLVVNY